MSARLCGKTEKHKGRPIEAFCLQSGCRKNRLLCFYCIFESHKNHEIAYLHKELDGPLSRLSAHADENIDCKDHFQNAFTGMLKYCDKLTRTVSLKVSGFRQHMQPQFEAIRKTFKKTSVDDIIKDLTSNHHITEEREERYVKMMRFYSNRNFYDFNTLLENVDAMEMKYGGAFERATERVEVVLRELLEEVLKFNLLNEKPEEADQIVSELQEHLMHERSDEPIKIDVDLVKGSAGEGERILEEKAVAGNDEMQCEENGGNMEKDKSVNNLLSERMGEDLCPSVVEIGSCSHPDKKMMSEEEEVVVDRVKGAHGGQMIISKPNRAVPQSNPSEQEASDNWNPPHRHSVLPTQPKQRQIRSQYLHEHSVQIINIYAPNTIAINKLLAKIKPETVKELSIYCSSQLCALDKESGRLISQFYGLRTLRVLWARGLSDDLVIYMIRHLPQLQNLCLAEFSNVTAKLVQSLKVNCLNLKSLFFTFDCSQNLFHLQSCIQFLPDIANYKIQQKLLEDLYMGLPELENMELCGVRNLSHWIYCISESRENLKQFSLCRYEGQTRMDYTPLVEALSQCSHLEAIKLEFVEFEERNLVALLKNNPNLRTVIISECSLSKSLFDAITKYCPQLKHLSISLEDKFTGQSLSNLPNLQTLIIRGCLSVRATILSHNLNKLKLLRCVSFNFNNVEDNWVNNKVLKAIGSMKRLTCLNLNHCKITAEDISHILRLTHLSTLVCDTNIFNYESILDLKSNLTLRKLGIGKNMQRSSQEEINLEMVHGKFPKLTHLKLCGFTNIEVAKLARFQKLVSLTVRDGVDKEVEEIDRYCRTKNIRLVADKNEKPEQ